MPDGDAALLVAWRSGDARAGQALFDRHVASLVRFFRNKADSAIEDLIQATFVACLESHHRFEGRGDFRAFLLGIARNKLYQHYRDRGGAMAEVDVSVHSLVDLAPGASTGLAEAAEHQLLLAALRGIPLELQVVLELYYWESMTAGQIAEVCELPEGTVRTRLRRARALVAEGVARLAAGDLALERTETDLERWAASIRDVWRES